MRAASPVSRGTSAVAVVGALWFVGFGLRFGLGVRTLASSIAAAIGTGLLLLLAELRDRRRARRGDSADRFVNEQFGPVAMAAHFEASPAMPGGGAWLVLRATQGLAGRSRVTPHGRVIVVVDGDRLRIVRPTVYAKQAEVLTAQLTELRCRRGGPFAASIVLPGRSGEVDLTSLYRSREASAVLDQLCSVGTF